MRDYIIRRLIILYSDVEYCAYRNDIAVLVITKTGGIYYNDIR